MADGEQEAVNKEGAAGSAPAGEQTQNANPPTGETSGASNEPVKTIPYPRFQEVIQQRNGMQEAYEAKIRELQSQLPANRESLVDSEAKRLAKTLKLDESAAKEILTSVATISGSERAQVEGRMKMYEIQEWSRNLANKHKDFGSYSSEMERVYSSLPPETQKMIVSSPVSLEMFYGHVKAQSADRKTAEALQNGASQAYQSKETKQQVSGASKVGSSSSNTGKSTLTKENIGAEVAKMDMKTYKERLEEINAVLR